MIKPAPLEELSFAQKVERLVPFLGEIDPDLMVIGNRVQLKPEDPPFLLVISRAEKRLGLIEILEPSRELPSHVLRHAAWVSENSYAISNLNRNEYHPESAPFIIALTPEFPSWKNLLALLALEIRLYHYSMIAWQDSSVVLFDLLYRPVDTTAGRRSLAPTVTNPPKAPQAEFLPAGSESRNVATAREPIRSDPFRESGPAGITEEEMRYFAN